MKLGACGRRARARGREDARALRALRARRRTSARACGSDSARAWARKCAGARAHATPWSPMPAENLKPISNKFSVRIRKKMRNLITKTFDKTFFKSRYPDGARISQTQRNVDASSGRQSRSADKKYICLLECIFGGRIVAPGYKQCRCMNARIYTQSSQENIHMSHSVSPACARRRLNSPTAT